MMLTFMVVCTCFFSVVNPVSAVENPFDEKKTYCQVVTEDFETGTLPETVTSNGARLEIVPSNRGTGLGALSVTPMAGSHSVFVMFGGNSGITYHLSVLSKNANITNMQFNVFSKTKAGNYVSQEVQIQTQTLADGWKKISGAFVGSSDSAGIGQYQLSFG